MHKEQILISRANERWQRRNVSRAIAIVAALLALVFLAATVARSQTSVADLKAKAKTEKLKDLIIQYDKFKDKTLISTKPQNLVGFGEAFAVGLARVTNHPSILLLSIGYEGKGNGLMATPETMAVMFHSNAKGWVFLGADQNLYILCGDQRREFAPIASDADIKASRLGGFGTSETLGFAISRAELQDIIGSKQCEMKLGDTIPRKWKSDWSKRVQALLTLTTLSPN